MLTITGGIKENRNFVKGGTECEITAAGAKALASLIFELYSGFNEHIIKKADAPMECPIKCNDV